MSKVDLKSMDLEELTRWVIELGSKGYRGKQIYQWIYRRGAISFDQMTDISESFREILNNKSRISYLIPRIKLVSTDQTRKYLFQLDDGETIESVMIPDEDRITLCLSTQVGCAMGCVFCLTGTMGLRRNLNTAEIVNQIMAVEQDLTDDPPKNQYGDILQPKESGPVKRYITNIVMMGMGEPMANLNPVIQSIRILSAQQGYNLAPRRITVSTVGLVPQIEKFAQADTGANLAISLTAASDEKRDLLLPINKKYPLSRLMQTIKKYPLTPRRRITFEYVLLKGINDTNKDAMDLIRLMKGIQCKINLIPMNQIPDFDYHPTEISHIRKFQRILWDAGLTATIRESRGRDILAACGQLKGNTKK